MKPRCILKNQTYMVSRRTTQRMFLLRPGKKINQCIRYCIALAAKASGVDIHAVLFMSNHYHTIVTDVEGKLPVFTETLNRLLARALNHFHGRGENFWAGHVQPSQVLLVEKNDVMSKMVYALCNPVQAGLVARGKQWPGVRIYKPGKYVCKRPDFFFRTEKDGGTMPKKIDLQLTLPTILGDSKAALSELEGLISEKEESIRSSYKDLGKTFMGKDAIMKQSPFDSPLTQDKTNGISPRIACIDKWRRVEVLQVLDTFVDAYKTAWREFKEGNLKFEFPLGTYKMALIESVAIAAPDC